MNSVLSVVNSKLKKEYPNHPVVWVENDFLQSYFYVHLDENAKVCCKCLGFVPRCQCANCLKLEPWWYDGIPGLFSIKIRKK